MTITAQLLATHKGAITAIPRCWIEMTIRISCADPTERNGHWLPTPDARVQYDMIGGWPCDGGRGRADIHHSLTFAWGPEQEEVARRAAENRRGHPVLYGQGPSNSSRYKNNAKRQTRSKHKEEKQEHKGGARARTKEEPQEQADAASSASKMG
eukprot:gene13635-biopygen5716